MTDQLASMQLEAKRQLASKADKLSHLQLEAKNQLSAKKA